MKFIKLRFKALSLFLIVIIIFISGLFIGTIYSDEAVRLFVNGKEIYCDVPPFIKGGRTFVPIRCIVEALQIPIKWNSAKREVLVGIPPEGIDLVNDIPAYEGQGVQITSYVVICGTKYKTGYIMKKNDDFLRWNLGGNYNIFKFSCGFLDGEKPESCCTIHIIADGTEIGKEKIDHSLGLGMQEFTFDVTSKKIITIRVDSDNCNYYFYSSLGIINPIADTY